jgi:hypothetical protein
MAARPVKNFLALNKMAVTKRPLTPVDVNIQQVKPDIVETPVKQKKIERIDFQPN